MEVEKSDDRLNYQEGELLYALGSQDEPKPNRE
jgi:hypothetical protein